jgi:arginyl-tRNA synthetase
MNTLTGIKKAFFECLQKITTVHELPSIEFGLNTDEHKQQFGDITTNAPMVLAKALGKNPRQIAHELIESFSHDAIAKMEIAGPGFLNIFLTPETIKTIAQELFANKDHYFELEEPTAIYNIEFISANPTGPLHFGHGRGGIIGDVIGNVLTFLGYKTSKEHYVNDAGSQINKLGASLKIRCRQEAGEAIELPEDAYHGQYMVNLAKKCLYDHPDALTKNDDFFMSYAYTHMLAGLQKTTGDYGITFDTWFSEKTLHTQAIDDAVALLTTNGKTYQQDGALWFKSTDYGDDKDRVLKKADGSYTYAAADAAYMLSKTHRGFEHLVFVLGQDHHSYPKRLNGIRQALGLADVTLDCILYQLVSMKEDGERVRMSKRAGSIVSLQDIIETVGADVARFFYLNRKADAHLEFNIELALQKTEENPVYYLQYAYVRTNAILKRSFEHPEFRDINQEDGLYLTQNETLLIKKLAHLETLLIDISKNYQVHLLTYYLLELAHLFHNYYHHNKVIEPTSIEQSRGRLFLVLLVKDMFERCFKIIGISLPEKM